MTAIVWRHYIGPYHSDGRIRCSFDHAFVDDRRSLCGLVQGPTPSELSPPQGGRCSACEASAGVRAKLEAQGQPAEAGRRALLNPAQNTVLRRIVELGGRVTRAQFGELLQTDDRYALDPFLGSKPVTRVRQVLKSLEARHLLRRVSVTEWVLE